MLGYFNPSVREDAFKYLQEELRTRDDLPMHLLEHMGILPIKKMEALMEADV